MIQDSFTAHLLSDSNMESNPENTHTDFTVRLPSPITLSNYPGSDAGWEVALTGVQYTPLWYNFHEDVCIRYLVQLPSDESSYVRESASGLFHSGESPGFGSPDHTLEDEVLYMIRDGTFGEEVDRIAGVTTEWVFYKTSIKRNYFESVQKLGNVICQEFARAFKPKFNVQLEFNIDVNTGFLQIRAPRGKVAIVINNPYLATVLGLSSRKLHDGPVVSGKPEQARLYLLNTSASATRKPRLEFVDDMYIYTDLTEYQIIGDQQAPILRIIPVVAETLGRRQYWGASSLEYLSVNKNYISTIRVIVCNVKGEKLRFLSDAPNFICTLRFRRKRSFTSI